MQEVYALERFYSDIALMDIPDGLEGMAKIITDMMPDLARLARKNNPLIATFRNVVLDHGERDSVRAATLYRLRAEPCDCLMPWKEEV
jgi:hypothetical protein